MTQRFEQTFRGAFWAGVAFLSVLVSGGEAQACRRCGHACSPCYQTVTQTVCTPTMVPETRVVTVTEYRCEVREQPVTVQRCVPETTQVKRAYTVMVPQVQTREQKYMVAVPVWEEVDQAYTVCVPYQEVRQGMRTVCRTVQVQEKRTVCRDMGHWEEVTTCAPCGGCRIGCGKHRAGCCGVAVCTQRVWCSNPVTEEVPVTVCKNEYVQEPCQYTVTLYKQEQRTQKVKVCRYTQEERTRQVQYTVCVPQQREVMQNVTTYKMVAEQRMRTYSVMVPHTVQKEVQVMVCRMVPHEVTCQVPVGCGCCSGCGK